MSEIKPGEKLMITPKNWGSFQHYKDRAPSWIKLHRSLLTDYEFFCLPVASRALAPFLWLLASEYEDGNITASLDELAFRVHMTRGEFADALSPLVEKGFFNASGLIAECKRTSSPEKRREEIQEKKEEEKDSRSVANATRPYANGFEEFWKAYPRRDGPNPRKPAEQKYNSLVKTGVDPAMLLAEVRKFASEAAARGDVGTRFIPQAVTWLSQQRWADHAAVAFIAETPKEIDWDAICATFKALGVWSKHAPGNDPSSPSCMCPPEILEKHGLLLNRSAMQ